MIPTRIKLALWLLRSYSRSVHGNVDREITIRVSEITGKDGKQDA